MKAFETPVIEVISFSAENIMSSSTTTCDLYCPADNSCNNATDWG